MPWDDRFLAWPAARLVDAELGLQQALAEQRAAAAAILRGNPDPDALTCATAAVTTALHARNQAEADWSDTEACWREGLAGGWLDPEPDGPEPWPELDEPEAGQ